MRSGPGVVWALVAAVVSGVAVSVNGVAVRGFADPSVYTTAKNLVAAAVLVSGPMIARVASGGRLVRTAGSGATPAGRKAVLALVAVVGGSVPFVLFFEGLARATSTNAAFIHKTLVVWVAVGAATVLSETVTAVHVAAIGVLVAGHLVVVGGPGPAIIGVAEVLVFAATLSWAAEILVVKRLLGDVRPATVAVVRMSGGSAVLVVWLAVTGRSGDLLSLDRTQWAWVALTGSILAVYVMCWFTALSLAPALDVTAVLVLGAVVTGLVDLGFGDGLPGVDRIGYVLICAGVLAVIGRATVAAPGTAEETGRHPAPRPLRSNGSNGSHGSTVHEQRGARTGWS